MEPVEGSRKADFTLVRLFVYIYIIKCLMNNLLQSIDLLTEKHVSIRVNFLLFYNFALNKFQEKTKIHLTTSVDDSHQVFTAAVLHQLLF